MKVDSSAAYIETPVKNVAEDAAELREVGSGSGGRCSPSAEKAPAREEAVPKDL